MKEIDSLMPSRDGDDKGKLGKTTSFRLAEDMLEKINAMRKKDGSSKDAAIRKLLSYGFILHEAMENRAHEVARDIAARGSPAQIQKGNR